MKRKMIKNIAIAMALTISLSIIPNKITNANATWTVVDYSKMTDSQLSAEDKALMHEDNWLNNDIANERGKTLATLTLDDFLSYTILDRTDLSLTTVPESLKFMTNLTKLYLGHNQIVVLPDGIGNLTSLTYLECNTNQLTSLPESIGNLTNLTTLSCSGAQLTRLPESIGNLTNLTTLYCGGAQLTSFPESIWTLTNLTSLDIAETQLTSLPDGIFNLTNLTSLSCGYNKLTSLPESIGNLTNLTTLYCEGNQLNSLPDSISNLTNLTGLYCGYNKLTSLPDSICNLNNLKILNCSKNQLTILPENIGNLTNLTSLGCYYNQLTSLPDSIGNLTNLTSLSCFFNQLTILPDSIGNLTNLTGLNCSRNQLTSLPDSIGNLTNLTSLNCNSNQLTNLPDSLGNLTKLSNFDASYNFLTSIPSNLISKTYTYNFINTSTIKNQLSLANSNTITINKQDKLILSSFITKTYGSQTMSQAVVDKLQVVADDPTIIDSTGKALKAGTTNIKLQLPNNPDSNINGITQTSLKVTVPQPDTPTIPDTPTNSEPLGKTSDVNLTFGLEDTLQLTLSSNITEFGSVSGITTIESSNNLVANVKSSLPYDVDLKATDDFSNLTDATAVKVPVNKLGVSVDSGSYSKFTGINTPIILDTSASSTKSLGDSGKDYQIKFNLDSTIGFDKGKYSAPLTITVTQK